jgi:hypothetical protein
MSTEDKKFFIAVANVILHAIVLGIYARDGQYARSIEDRIYGELDALRGEK